MLKAFARFQQNQGKVETKLENSQITLKFLSSSIAQFYSRKSCDEPEKPKTKALDEWKKKKKL